MRIIHAGTLLIVLEFFTLQHIGVSNKDVGFLENNNEGGS